MNPFFKLIAAAMLLAGGFVVARWMGDPAVRTGAPASVADRLAQFVSPAPPVNVSASSNTLSSGARLIPDHEAAPTVKNDRAELLSTIAPPLFSSEAMPPANPHTIERPRPLAPVVVSNERPAMERVSPIGPPPRASLRDEAPRPLEFDRPPATVRFPPITAAYPPVPIAQPPVTPSAGSHAAIGASYEAPAAPPPTAPLLAPPPWPIPTEAEEARTHVIVDGDSLARLARRYLGDERRGNEIYELNRGVLADPELLPIGAELALPQRGGATLNEPRTPDSFADRTAPRAQLLPPLLIDPVGAASRAAP